MKQNFLQIGDVFAVGYGMQIYCTINGNERDVTVYPHIDNMTAPLRKMATEIKINFVVFSEAHKFLTEQYKNVSERNAETRAFCGNYVVTEAHMGGGGQGGHRSNDIYPNGHHVFAKQLNHDGTFNPDGLEINFYQSGCFTALNENVPVIRKMAPSFA